jgi:hypothetical protein
MNRGMLAGTWEELEFRLDVLRAKQGTHIEVRREFEKKCLYPSNKISFTFFLAIYNFQLNCKIGQRRVAHSVYVRIFMKFCVDFVPYMINPNSFSLISYHR